MPNSSPHNSTESPQKPARQFAEQLANTLPEKPVPPRPWQEANYRPSTYLTAGLFVGALAGCTSLLFNIVGGLLWSPGGQELQPLRLIQVYLTFPLGAAALELNSGLTLALGCLLYLATGMMYGLLFEFAMSWFVPQVGLLARVVICSLLALLVWAVNFYGILAWLQPLLIGGRWIVELVPWWVAAFTHLIFGWTVALLYPLARVFRSTG